MSKEKIWCKVKDDSSFPALRGLSVAVIRDKAFYKIININFSNTGLSNELITEIANEYLDFHIGREELDFENTKANIPEFPSGAKRVTEGKEDFIETMSFLAERRYAQYMTEKAKTYGPGNWRKGIPIESYEKSLRRHINKYLANKYDNANIEPDEDHLSAALFNLLGIIHEEERNKLNNK